MLGTLCSDFNAGLTAKSGGRVGSRQKRGKKLWRCGEGDMIFQRRTIDDSAWTRRAGGNERRKGG